MLSNNQQSDDYISLLTNSGFFTKTDAESFSDKFEEATILSTNEKSYCVVIKAKKHGKWHAIKRLKKEYSSDQFYINLFEKEFEISYHLDHPNIAQVVSKEYDSNGMYIVSEYIDGITLKEFIKKNSAISSGLKRKIITEIAEALNYIHSKQIIHRDLKPENILITFNGSNCKLIDFGLSDTDSFHILKQPAGTIKYAAPELLNNEKNITSKVDLYSLGKIILDLWSASINEIDQIEKPFCKIAKKCLEDRPNARYDNSKAVIADLTASLKLNSKFYYLTGFLAFIIVAIFILYIQNQTITTNKNTSLANDKIKQDQSVQKSIDTVYKKSITPGIKSPKSLVFVQKRLASKKNEHLEIGQNLEKDDIITLEAKELIPKIASSFFNRYKSSGITLQNDYKAGLEWGELQQRSIPEALNVFRKKLPIGSPLEYQCEKILEHQYLILRKAMAKMFEEANEARGIPSQRKSGYMYKMYTIYSDSIYANMKKGHVNKDKIKQFTDSAAKYEWIKTNAVKLKIIVVPDTFKWEFK